MLEWHQKMMTFKQSTPHSTFDLTLTITKNWMHIQFAFVLLFDECSHSISKNTNSKTNVNWMYIRFTIKWKLNVHSIYIRFAIQLTFNYKSNRKQNECSHSISKNTNRKTNVNRMYIRFNPNPNKKLNVYSICIRFAIRLTFNYKSNRK